MEANPPKTHLNESVISLNSYFCFPRAMLIFAYLGPRMMRSQTTTEFRGCESETGVSGARRAGSRKRVTDVFRSRVVGNKVHNHLLCVPMEERREICGDTRKRGGTRRTGPSRSRAEPCTHLRRRQSWRRRAREPRACRSPTAPSACGGEGVSAPAFPTPGNRERLAYTFRFDTFKLAGSSVVGMMNDVSEISASSVRSTVVAVALRRARVSALSIRVRAVAAGSPRIVCSCDQRMHLTVSNALKPTLSGESSVLSTQARVEESPPHEGDCSGAALAPLTLITVSR